jgi:hypothetical protein
MDLAGSVTVGAMVIMVMQLQFAAMKREARVDKERNDKLDKKVTDLEREITSNYEKRVAHVEEELGAVNKRCRADSNHETLIRIEGMLLQVGNKVDKIDREMSGVQSELKAKDGWIGKIDDTVAAHVQNLGIHQTGNR